jgi:ABC-type multidrug transport system ATPase subunit
MNDYYSQFPQPSADVRARNIVGVMLRDQKFRDYFTPDELKDIALKVVKVSKEYSHTGYNMFGYAEERQRMISTLESKMRQRPYEECF